MRNSMKWWKRLKEKLPKTKKKKGNQKKSSFDELLALQNQQIDIQREQNERYEKMMLETLEEQRKKWQGGMGKRPRVFYATWKGSK